MPDSRNPEEIGILWRKVCDRSGKVLWSGRVQGVDVVAFTFKTQAGREGMSIQVSRRTPHPGGEPPCSMS